ncbi:MAG: cobalamin-dependent protein [Myxococcaceae bacterium]|nr:cobalamin-dependent protein [Myxococcaceae bacterium]
MRSLDIDILRSRYLAAQLNGERREALRLIVEEGLDHGIDPAVLRRDIVAAAQLEIGRLWQENRISVADEHMATAISQVVLAYLYQRSKAAKARGHSIVVACVEGELHDLPARLVADALDLEGYDVRFLGANVPTNHLLRALSDKPVDLVVLSVTISFNVPSARAAVTQLRAAHPDLKIAVGGGAARFAPDLCRQLGSDLVASDADTLIAAVNGLWSSK